MNNYRAPGRATELMGFHPTSASEGELDRSLGKQLSFKREEKSHWKTHKEI